MWKAKILLVCLLPALLCGAEPAARRNVAPLIGVVRFITASNAAADINNAGQIRIFMAKSIEVSKKFSVVGLETLDTFMREQDILPLKLYKPEEMQKIPPYLAQFLITGFVSVEQKNYRVRIHLLDLEKQEILFNEEALVDGANETTLFYGVMALTKRFLETVENTILFDEVEQEKQYKTGDEGPAGGIIFYAKPSRSNGWRYLEAAPPQIEFRAPWGLALLDGFIAPSFLDTRSELGTGRDNTEDIAGRSIAWENHTDIAAQLCRAVSYGGYSDWFLPSKDELMLMYTNLALKGIGGFSGEPYWTSTESSYEFACFQSFREGKQFFNGYKTMPMYVRAIRAF
ncbi:MAG: DUF1566 domain-containing protein [Spirochaetaceae bacterium]|jgi:hypothetical protein|nr:DUF1566 domain-containing protein [Spirochaetaceae bacterium]